MKKDGNPRWIALLGLIIALLSILISITAGLGTRFEMWFFRTGLTVLSWSVFAGIAGAVVSLAGIIILMFNQNKKGLAYGFVGLILGLLVAFGPWSMMQKAKNIPAIHDITTDTVNPPQFVAALPLRKNAVNSPVYEGPAVAALQEKAYPDIKTVILPFSTDEAFDRSMNIARKFNWSITAQERSEGRIEAVDTTFWMGFKDDIVIRIAKNGTGSRIDIRSESRVGKGDFGANAKRIRKFLKEIQSGFNM